MFQVLAEELVVRGHHADIIAMGMQGDSASGPVRGHRSALRGYVLGKPPRWAPQRGAAKYLPNLWRLHWNRGLARWLEGPYDLFLFATPGIMSAAAGQRLRMSGVARKTGFVLWDFFPVAHVEAGSLALGPLERPAYALERKIARESDILLPMSPAGARYARSYYGLPGSRMAILPPWGRATAIPSSQPKFSRFTCAWGGQFIARRAIPDLLHAARIIADKGLEVDFRLAGDGPLLSDCEDMARDLALPNVHFEGRLSREDYLALLTRSHVALSIMEPSTSPSFPSKTVDYCQAGLPLIASVEEGNDYGQIMEDAGAGVATTAGNVPGIASAVARLLAMSAGDRDEMSLASRRFFEERLTVGAAAITIERVVMNLANWSATAPVGFDQDTPDDEP